MDFPDLAPTSPFWTNDDNGVLLNPRGSNASAFDEIHRALESHGLTSHVVFATSGSTGAAKFACISKKALLYSAAMVNEHLDASGRDRWLCALPVFHVGGFGICARAHVAKGELHVFERDWDAEAFAETAARVSATMSSLVPTQVYDLVQTKLAAPKSLRAIVVGGGALDGTLRNDALELGWPILESYGMTEASSQVATRRPSDMRSASPKLLVLSGWGVRSDTGTGIFEIFGDSRFSGYLKQGDDGQWALTRPFDRAGWFRTSDRVVLTVEDGKTWLEPCGRCDSIVKIRGENVDVEKVQRELGSIGGLVVVAVPDLRTGSRLIGVVEEGVCEPARIDGVLRLYNARSGACERVLHWMELDSIPRSGLGKPLRQSLKTKIKNCKNLRAVNLTSESC